MKLFLTCLDGSPRASKVLSTAVDLARRTGAKLMLFRSVGFDPDLRDDVVGMSGDEIRRRMLEKARKELDDLAKAVPSDLLQGSATHLGTPWDAICREAKQADCDLIVIGAHGYDALDRVIGTTAAKVVNHADRTVLVVR